QLQQMPDTTVYLTGFDKLEQGFTGLKQVDFHDLEPEKLDVVILPITGVNSSGELETVFSDQQIVLSKGWFTRLRPSTLIFTGITTPYLTKMTEELDLDLV